MKAKDMMSAEIPVLSPETSADEGLASMQASWLSALPVVHEGLYTGMIHEKELRCSDPKEKVGGEHRHTPAVQTDSHTLEVLNQFAQFSDDILPVVDSGRRYIGAIPVHSALKALAQLCQTASAGAIIELEIPQKDYSAAELTRLVEDNDCRVINLLARPDEERGCWTVCLRIDREEPDTVLRSLERFGYQVLGCYRSREILNDRMEQRVKELIYYLEM